MEKSSPFHVPRDEVDWDWGGVGGSIDSSCRHVRCCPALLCLVVAPYHPELLFLQSSSAQGTSCFNNHPRSLRLVVGCGLNVDTTHNSMRCLRGDCCGWETSSDDAPTDTGCHGEWDPVTDRLGRNWERNYCFGLSLLLSTRLMVVVFYKPPSRWINTATIHGHSLVRGRALVLQSGGRHMSSVNDHFSLYR